MIKKAQQQRNLNVRLNDALEKRIRNYALAATASSVAVLALAQPGESEVVYTPANQNIAYGGVLDLNNDGIVDFTFRPFYYTSHTSCAIARLFALYVAPSTPSNAVRGGGSALPSSILVGRNPQKFKQGQGFMVGWNDIRFICTSSRYDNEILGPFANTADRYLGLQFSVNGETFYGWARFNVTDTGRSVSAILTGYAYEMTPGAPIFTGNEFGNELRDSPKPRTQAADGPVIPPADPATLGRLAQGAQGLAAWRVGAVAKPK